jgi:hypothetical protein
MRHWRVACFGNQALKSSARKSQEITDLYRLIQMPAKAWNSPPSTPASHMPPSKSRRTNAAHDRRLRRDPTDDVFVASAVTAQTAFVVTQDRDLLALQKPFGVQS